MSHRPESITGVRLASFITVGLVLGVATWIYAQTPVVPPGSGTSGDPYRISQVGHLVWMGDNVADSSGKYYTMTADIDASATAGWNDDGTGTDVLEGFKPIGTYSNPDTKSFRGVFDGNGHTISGLVVNRPNTYRLGLFGCIGSDGQVRNLGLVGGAVTGAAIVGGLVGDNVGTVSYCYATGAVTAYDEGGGLVGDNVGTVSYCYATGAVMGGDYIGGLVGGNFTGTVSNCYATGAVTGNVSVGGLVGQNRSGRVSNCYATGAVTGFCGIFGGLVGDGSEDKVSNSYWDMQTSGLSGSYGGVGKTTAEMKQQATFVGWDFIDIWGIDEGTSYPYLRFSPPMVTAAVSRKTHGSAGDMDLDLMRSGAVECRKNGPTQVVVTFDRNLQQAGWLIYNVGVSNGTVNAAVINGNKLIIIMSGVSDASLLTIGYTVIKGTTAEAVTGTLCFGVLMGDTRTDKYVNVLDLLLIKKAINKPVTNTNFYPDINADGNINVLDLQAAKNNMNKSISGSCP